MGGAHEGCSIVAGQTGHVRLAQRDDHHVDSGAPLRLHSAAY